MHRPWFRGAALLIAASTLFGATGCGLLDQVTGDGGGGPTAAPTASPTPPPDPTEEELRLLVRRGTVELAGFHKETDDAPEDKAGTWKLLSTCKELPSDKKRTVGYQRLWDGDKIWIRNYVVGFLDVEGSTLVTEAREQTPKCKKYKNDGTTITVLDPVELTAPEGIDDIFGYCEKVGSGSVYQCNAVLARGHLVAQIDAGDGPQANSEKLLRKLIPLVAEALVDAA